MELWMWILPSSKPTWCLGSWLLPFLNPCLYGRFIFLRKKSVEFFLCFLLGLGLGWGFYKRVRSWSGVFCLFFFFGVGWGEDSQPKKGELWPCCQESMADLPACSKAKEIPPKGVVESNSGILVFGGNYANNSEFRGSRRYAFLNGYRYHMIIWYHPSRNNTPKQTYTEPIWTGCLCARCPTHASTSCWPPMLQWSLRRKPIMNSSLWRKSPCPSSSLLPWWWSAIHVTASTWHAAWCIEVSQMQFVQWGILILKQI